MADHFGLSLDTPQTQSELRALTAHMVKYLSPVTTGVLLDPLVSYYALPEKDSQCGSLFCLDTPTVQRDPLKPPPLITHWGVEHVANNDSVVKLELYYNPYEPESAVKKALVAEVHSYAQHEGVAFLLELLLFEYPAKEHQFDELQVFAVQEFRSYCDILALDYPQSPLGAATITAELDIPWVLSHRAEKYEAFKEELRICAESGASGYLAGEVFWQDSQWWKEKKLSVPDAAEELQKTTRDRIIELERIVTEQLEKGAING